MHIARLVIENNKVVGEERLLAGEFQRFRDVTQGEGWRAVCGDGPGACIGLGKVSC